YAGDGGEPPHVHVERDDCEAKFWINPVRLERSRGFIAKELRQIREIVMGNQRGFLESWNEYFNG
ncbi:MAG: DUF4160 domain-containing protein, partial [Pirellulales bacterium]